MLLESRELLGVGGDRWGLVDPPDGEYNYLRLQNIGGCGITRNEHKLRCWGDSEEQGRSIVESSSESGFVQGDSGEGFQCAINRENNLSCWGRSDPTDHQVESFRFNEDLFDDPTDTPDREFVKVVAGGNHVCALDEEGGIECWGYGADGRTNPPEGKFVDLDAVNRQACAVEVNGDIYCWGALEFEEEWFTCS